MPEGFFSVERAKRYGAGVSDLLESLGLPPLFGAPEKKEETDQERRMREQEEALQRAREQEKLYPREKTTHYN